MEEGLKSKTRGRRRLRRRFRDKNAAELGKEEKRATSEERRWEMMFPIALYSSGLVEDKENTFSLFVSCFMLSITFCLIRFD